MKNFIALSALLFSIFGHSELRAGDDVYDAIREREVKAKISYSNNSTEQTEKTVPYSEEDNNRNSRRPESDYSNESGYYPSSDNYNYDGWNNGYSDRIMMFHNPSIRFSAGWGAYNNTWYDPWNPYSTFGTYSFTPTWLYSYNDYNNPFWGASPYGSFYDPMMSWYNPGFYNPAYYWNWYSPACAAILYNNAYPYYGYSTYYDSNRKTVVTGPRTGTYHSNTNHGFNSNTNNPNLTQPGNNSSTPANKRWSNPGNNTQPGRDVYRYSRPEPNTNPGNWNRENANPSNNGDWGKSNNSGGVKLGTKPK